MIKLLIQPFFLPLTVAFEVFFLVFSFVWIVKLYYYRNLISPPPMIGIGL